MDGLVNLHTHRVVKWNGADRFSRQGFLRKADAEILVKVRLYTTDNCFSIKRCEQVGGEIWFFGRDRVGGEIRSRWKASMMFPAISDNGSQVLKIQWPNDRERTVLIKRKMGHGKEEDGLELWVYARKGKP